MLLIDKHSIRKDKNLSIKEKYNKSTYFFLNSLFHSLIRDGKKFRTLNVFFKLFFLIKVKFNNVEIFFFFYIIFHRLYSKIYLRPQHVGFKIIHLIPVISIRKSIFLAKSWILTSLIERRERTLLLKLYAELHDILNFKGIALRKKIQYYKLVKQSWINIRFLRYSGINLKPRMLMRSDKTVINRINQINELKFYKIFGIRRKRRKINLKKKLKKKIVNISKKK